MNLLDQIDQPTLLLDESVTHRSIERMVLKAGEKLVQFRPHFKTHQSAQIGEWFRAKGVDKITVSSVEMAEYFADSGWKDILIAFSLNPRQIERIKLLSRRIHLEVLIENEEALVLLDNALDVEVEAWVKIDAGNHRTGLDWEETTAVASLCNRIKASHYLKLNGLLTHSGNTYQARSKAEICELFRDGVDRLKSLRLELEKEGFAGLKISVGDTPGCTICEDWSSIDEVRPGNFVFYDAMQALAHVCEFKDISVALACPVVAKHRMRREVVVYGGAIHLSKDFAIIDGEKSYGLPALQSGSRWGEPIPGAIVKSLSQEHGIVRIPGEEFDKIAIGDLLFILPAHSCLTVQVMGSYLTLGGETIPTLNRTKTSY